VSHTGGDHADGRLVDHVDDSDGYADLLSEKMEKHEKTDDGNTQTRGAEKWSRLNRIDCFIHVFVHFRYQQATTPQRYSKKASHVYKVYTKVYIHTEP